MSKLKGVDSIFSYNMFIVGVLGMLELLGLSIPRVKCELSSFKEIYR